MDDSSLTCSVCHNEPAAGVCNVPGLPVSMAYGRKCLTANAHPYELLVANTAMCGGYSETDEWWQHMVDDTLSHLHMSRTQFDKDVAIEMEEMPQP